MPKLADTSEPDSVVEDKSFCFFVFLFVFGVGGTSLVSSINWLRCSLILYLSYLRYPSS